MITAETVHNLLLKKSFYGYDVRKVDDFLEQVEEQLAQDTQGMEELRGDLIKAAEGKDKLRQQVETLTAELDNAVTAQRELQKEVDRLNGVVEQYEQNNTKIEDALIEIYRMREMMMKDAAAQADETRKAAETALAQAREEADQVIRDARAYKAAMDGECEQLYQKILDFRTIALEIYRRQMEAIKVFPEHRPVYGLSEPMTIIQDVNGENAVFSGEED